jgi:hypothetical protein
MIRADRENATVPDVIPSFSELISNQSMKVPSLSGVYLTSTVVHHVHVYPFFLGVLQNQNAGYR